MDNTVVKSKIVWDSGDFANIKGIFNLFKAAGYTVEDINPTNEIPLLGKVGEQMTRFLKEIYKIVDNSEKNFHVWVIIGTEPTCNKFWRRAINDIIARNGGNYVLFYTTETFSMYHIAMIRDRVKVFTLETWSTKLLGIEVKFLPLKPGALADRILTKLLDHPLFERRDFGVCYNEIENYSRNFSSSITTAAIMIFAGIGMIIIFSFFNLDMEDFIINIGIGVILLLLGIFGLIYAFKHG